MIRIDIKKKDHGSKKILGAIRFEVAQGEFLSIIGPSGCGKTTLLSLIASLDTSFEGNINVDTASIGMMFQEPRLLPWLTVKENIAVVARNKETDEIVKLLRMVGLEHTLELYPKALSGGMARRVSLVRAFINKPGVILLDEPFVSLDTPTAVLLQQDLMTFCKTFAPTVVLVTHNLDEAIALSQKILFFGGDPTQEIFTHTNTHSGFETLQSYEVAHIKEEILRLHPKILEGKL